MYIFLSPTIGLSRKGGIPMKRLAALFLTAAILITPAQAVTQLPEDSFDLPCSAALLMERSSGEVIYEKNAFEHLSPASVTKVMTLLLIAEAVDRGDISVNDMVTASARACSMGGSQIWLKEGETFPLSDLLKCVAVVSANDCSVALAEYLCGSEDAFVHRMNERAAELGMENSHFTNCTGLFESDEHYTCAYDIALMSRELLSHEFIREYTTIWMDSIRDGAFELTNTNRLVHSYAGATGLKTGYTSKAMYCLSASAERDGTEFIAVVLHAETSNDRFDAAQTLLNYAFANYTTVSLYPANSLPPVLVELGKEQSILAIPDGNASLLIEKGMQSELRYETELPEKVTAPVTAGAHLGSHRLYSGDTLLAEVPLLADRDSGRLNTFDIFMGLLRYYFGGKAIC